MTAFYAQAPSGINMQATTNVLFTITSILWFLCTHTHNLTPRMEDILVKVTRDRGKDEDSIVVAMVGAWTVAPILVVMFVDILVATWIEMMVDKIGHMLDKTVATTPCTNQSTNKINFPSINCKIKIVLLHIPIKWKPPIINSTAIPADMAFITMDGTVPGSVANNITYLMWWGTFPYYSMSKYAKWT